MFLSISKKIGDLTFGITLVDHMSSYKKYMITVNTRRKTSIKYTNSW